MSARAAEDTIFALSSGAVPAAIAVVRVSGVGAGDALWTLAGFLPEPRRAVTARLRAVDGSLLDHALVLWLPGPRTATGEDLVELHLHGGRAVVAAMLAALEQLPGLRLAEAGEFTRRAFHNGRLDLAQVEGLADLLTSETEMQRRDAIRRAEGGLGRLAEQWREQLLALRAHVEAALQFGEEEEDVPALDTRHATALAELHGEILDAVRQPPAERLRDGVRVLIAGPVNAGKSSLLNALARRNAAIISDKAGTTRDMIEVPIQVMGLPILLIDTAGLRETSDPVERIGIDRAEEAMASADLIIWLGDSADRPPRDNLIVVHSRCDQAGRHQLPDGADVAVSAKTGKGLDVLLRTVIERGRSLVPGEDRLSLTLRQRTMATTIADHLAAAQQVRDHVLVAEHLMQAAQALDAVVGRSGVEDMLDSLFGRFCIGK
ncbi:tRNA uridine-5-carboxymethylaminomethyl(34) synthesis GTPase MnmE [uncultured Sphingomonas sp.]|uniref:tRNA uridine-5-carboxymethylaminomethyl(34) synthesis GTPase MnmE n=1 Tax=uncultured Sphingomonas sp. TaxID=158754 RepID=UPI0025F9B4CE|nr:tRNA uridine-5-carboxymethylaminomethyl(34) synthesis GTPase MnmE [uncultured Sphingomonas sp.]